MGLKKYLKETAIYEADNTHLCYREGSVMGGIKKLKKIQRGRRRVCFPRK